MYNCATVRPNEECVHMRKDGCSFEGGTCYPISEKCVGEEKGCEKIYEVGMTHHCRAYANPEIKWLSGNCPLASHLVKEKEEKGKFVNPIKYSKRKKK